MDVLAGSTDVTTYVVLRLAADGTEATGLTITNIDLQYCRSGAAPAAKVDATALAAIDTAHTDNYGIEIDATDQPGLYRIDWPDAAFAAGVREVVLSVKCATAFTEHIRVNLTPVPANVEQWKGTAAAAVDTAGYPKVTVKSGTGTGEISLTSGVASVNVTQLGGGAQSATDLKDFADTGYDPVAHTSAVDVGAVDATQIATAVAAAIRDGSDAD